MVNQCELILFYKFSLNIILWLLSKINKLELEVSDLHETIDSLEEKLVIKENILKESNELLFNKLDGFSSVGMSHLYKVNPILK